MKHGSMWCPYCNARVLAIIDRRPVGLKDVTVVVGLIIAWACFSAVEGLTISAAANVNAALITIAVAWIPARLAHTLWKSRIGRCATCGTEARITATADAPRNTRATR